MCCVVVDYLETWRMRRPSHQLGRNTTGGKKNTYIQKLESLIIFILTVWPRDVSPQRIRMAIDDFLNSLSLFQQLEGHKRSLISRVFEAGFSTSNDVKLVVCELQSLMDSHCDRQ